MIELYVVSACIMLYSVLFFVLGAHWAGMRRENKPREITGWQTWAVHPGEDIPLIPSPPGTEPCGEIRPIGVVTDGSGLVLVYVRPHCRSKSL